MSSQLNLIGTNFQEKFANAPEIDVQREGEKLCT